MGKYQVHQTDQNAPLVIDAIKAAGGAWEPLHRPVDGLVSVDGVCGAAEIKTRLGKLRPSQEAFLKRFQGPVAILRTPEDAFAFVRRLKQIAKRGARPAHEGEQ